MQRKQLKKAVWGAFIWLIAAAPSQAFLGWRQWLRSTWPEKPVQIDGRANEWSLMPVIEEEGLSFRAMNDASNLYLLVRGTADEGRTLLSGKYRQNVTFWFLKPDGKSRDWGINLDFSQAHPPAPPANQGAPAPVETAPSFAALGVTPEKVLPQGLEVSTATLPLGIEMQADLSSKYGRQPVYEMRIPLAMIERKGTSIFLNFTSSEVNPEVKAELQARQAEERAAEKSRSEGGAPEAGGHGGHHGRMRAESESSESTPHPSVEIPKPLTIPLTIHLAQKSG
jgi:hypothetical protein